MGVTALVVPGGGIDDAGAPRPWVGARLDRAVELRKQAYPGAYVIVLSRGTTNKPPPPDPLRPRVSIEEGGAYFALDEATASARYLLQRGVEPDRVLAESWSLDTIGNAYACRWMITEPLGIENLVVITSAFHMARTRAIFDWIYTLPPFSGEGGAARLQYEEVPNVGMNEEMARFRTEKELSSLENLRKTIERVGTDRGALARFLFVEHDAYAVPRFAKSANISSDLAKTY